MDISELMNSVVEFYRAYPIIAVAIGLFALYLIYRKPKFFLSVFLIAALLAGTIYIILNMASSGVSEKEKLIKKQESSHKEE